MAFQLIFLFVVMKNYEKYKLDLVGLCHHLKLFLLSVIVINDQFRTHHPLLATFVRTSEEDRHWRL